METAMAHLLFSILVVMVAIISGAVAAPVI
jgi:hypothetical protein